MLMKVVLSRKGFDSSNGGIVSPIFEDGTMISFPIPSDDRSERNIYTDYTVEEREKLFGTPPANVWQSFLAWGSGKCDR